MNNSPLIACQPASGQRLQWRPARVYPSFAIIPLRVASSPGVMPAGRRTAFHPSTNSAVYTWPWPAGALAANGRSALTSQKVTKGTQNIALSTSLPGGWLVQSGSPVTGALAGPDRGVGDQAPAALPRVTGGFAVVHPIAARRWPPVASRHVPRHQVGPLCGGRHTRCPQIAAPLDPQLAAAQPEPPARSPATGRGDGHAGSAARRIEGADTTGAAC